jgi:hypothetical protein
MMNCIGDCNGLLWISLGNETGDPWKVAERYYHLVLMNGGDLAKTNMPPRLALKRIDDPRFSEAYETEPVGKMLHNKHTWYVEKDASGRVTATISCSRETPQVSCNAKFSSAEYPGLKVDGLLFHGQRLDQWRDIRATVERFLKTIVDPKRPRQQFGDIRWNQSPRSS